MTAFRLNVVGLFFQLLGTLFLVLDSIRISIRLPKEGIRLGDPPQVDSWIYHWASSIGFGLLFVGFVLCGVALWLSRTKSPNRLTEVPETKQAPATTGTSSIAQGVLKFVSAAVICLAAWQLVSWRASQLEKSLVAKAPVKGAPAQQSVHRVPGTVKDFEKALQEMMKTNDLLINWVIALLGGSIAVALLAKGARIRDHNWGLTFVPPAWVLLIASLLNGADFKRTLTFQLAKGEYVFSTLNFYLFLQLEFFRWSLFWLTFLALWYLFFRFALLEEKVKGDTE